MESPKIIMNISNSVIGILMASACALLLQPQEAVAGTITFDDATDGVTATLSADIMARGTGNQFRISCTAAEVCTVTFQGPDGTRGGRFNSFNLLEGNTQVVSDTILVGAPNPETALGPLDFTIIFTSNTEGTILAPLQGPSLPETGNFQSLLPGIVFLNANGNIIATDTIVVRSDVERVPEPGTISLIGIAVAGLAWSKRRQPAIKPALTGC